jgi:aryl-alcohol dehydrogenase (NADP+)
MYYQDVDFAITDRVGEVATRLGISRAQVALAWILQKPGVTSPVVGTTSVAHIEDLIAGMKVTLEAEDIARVETPYRPKGILGF